jgi:hypothetical protein
VPGSTPVSRRTWTSGSQRLRAKREAAQQAERQEEQRRAAEAAAAERRQRDTELFGRGSQRSDRPTPDDVLARLKALVVNDDQSGVGSAYSAGVDAAARALDFSDAPWLNDEYIESRMHRYRELQQLGLTHLLSRHGPEVTGLELIERCFKHENLDESAQVTIERDDATPRLQRQPSIVSAFKSPYSLVFAEHKLLMHPRFAELELQAHQEAMARGTAGAEYTDGLTVRIEVPLVTVFPVHADRHLHGYRRAKMDDGMWRPVHVPFTDATEWELVGRFRRTPSGRGSTSWEPVSIYARQLKAIRIAHGSRIAPGESLVEYRVPYLQMELQRVIEAGQRPHPESVEVVARSVELLARRAALEEQLSASAGDQDQVVELPPL